VVLEPRVQTFGVEDMPTWHEDCFNSQFEFCETNRASRHFQLTFLIPFAVASLNWNDWQILDGL